MGIWQIAGKGRQCAWDVVVVTFSLDRTGGSYLWGGPLVRGRRPRRSGAPSRIMIVFKKQRSGGTRADLGVRPVTLDFSPCPATHW